MNTADSDLNGLLCVLPKYVFFQHITIMGRLRFVGSLKLQVSFAEYSLFYRALLQLRPIILRSLLIVATQYNQNEVNTMYCDMNALLCVSCIRD